MIKCFSCNRETESVGMFNQCATCFRMTLNLNTYRDFHMIMNNIWHIPMYGGNMPSGSSNFERIHEKDDNNDDKNE